MAARVNGLLINKKVTIRGDWLQLWCQSPFEHTSGHAGILWILLEDYPKQSISAIKATLGFGHQAVIVEFTRQTDKLCADDNTVAMWRDTALILNTLLFSIDVACGFVLSKQIRNTAFLSQNFILTYSCLDDAVCHETFLFVQEINWPNAHWLRSKKRKTKSDEVKKNTQPQETTTKSYLVSSNSEVFFSFLKRPSGVRNGSSSSLMESMRRCVTSQVQQPQDDVTGVAAFQLAALLVCFLLWHAGLVQGAALCGRSRS